MYFEIIGEIEDIETIAVGGRIRDIRKIYSILPDDNAKKEGYLRVIDESGEDYLYPESYFVLIQLPRKVQEAIQMAI